MSALLREISRPSKRSIIFGSVIAVCFLFLGVIAETLPDRWFFAAAILVFLVLLLELFITSNHYHIVHRKNTNALYEFEEHLSIQLAHHVALPLLLLFSSILFLFFNRQPSLYFLIIIITFIIFSILFENIYAFYRHKFSLHKETLYIYDILSGVAVFFITNAIINAQVFWNINSFFTILLFLVGYGIIIILLTLRNSVSVKEVLIALAVIVLMTIFFELLKSFDLSALFVSYVVALLYYAYNIFVNYFIERVITKEEMLDFLLVIMLAFTLLQFSGS